MDKKNILVFVLLFLFGALSVVAYYCDNQIIAWLAIVAIIAALSVTCLTYEKP